MSSTKPKSSNPPVEPHPEQIALRHQDNREPGDADLGGEGGDGDCGDTGQGRPVSKVSSNNIREVEINLPFAEECGAREIKVDVQQSQ